MAKNHYFLGTQEDSAQLHSWLIANGAEVLLRFNEQGTSTESSVVFSFPKIGGVNFWPEKIDASVYPEGSDRWKKALLNTEVQQQNIGRKVIDYDRSAVALLHEPCLKDGIAWVMGELSFPAAKLKETFPELQSINSAFGRWLRKNQLVYDWTGKEIFRPYASNLLGVSNCIKVFALPNAFELLKGGTLFVDRLISPKKFDEHISKSRSVA